MVAVRILSQLPVTTTPQCTCAILSCNGKSRADVLHHSVCSMVALNVFQRVFIFIPDRKKDEYKEIIHRWNLDPSQENCIALVVYPQSIRNVGNSRNQVIHAYTRTPQVRASYKAIVMIDERVHSVCLNGKRSFSNTEQKTTERLSAIIDRISGEYTNTPDGFAAVNTLSPNNLVSISEQGRNRKRKNPNAFAEKDRPIIAQMVIMNTENVYRLQGILNRDVYPNTTMGEDIYLAFMWNHYIGKSVEVRKITMLRDHKPPTLTRLSVNLDHVPDSVLREYQECFSSKIYQVSPSGKPIFKWTDYSMPQEFVHRQYSELSQLLLTVVDECRRRKMRTPLYLEQLYQCTLKRFRGWASFGSISSNLLRIFSGIEEGVES